MIRINLLPIKQERKKEALRNQLIIGFLVVAVEVLILFIMFMGISDDIKAQKNENGSLDAQIKRIESSMAEHKEILKEIDEYIKRQEAIDALVAARTGPVNVMLEISRILSRSGKPTIHNDRYQALIKENPIRGYDEDWDFRRVWINTFREKDRNVTITGQGVSHEDVAEFLRRLNLSDFFVSSELVSTSLAVPKVKTSGLELKNMDKVVSFSLIGSVKYK
ncbi:MAG: PilN domain-containing protein [Proteobacteria bacterium]|jgi:type IV pilus assembly protein PilN|nr:PilN domain-containing protein [Pseudomonadota bacterium]NLN62292.1 PilN domain-containing protein [Myxococcales bacterium]